MADDILNENQRRRVATHLHLLEEDMATLGRLPALGRPGAPYDGIRALLAEITGQVEELRITLDLGEYRPPLLQRRVGAVAEIWAVRVEDLVARRLKNYGRVHPGLAERLDARMNALGTLLGRLADAAVTLPEV